MTPPAPCLRQHNAPGTYYADKAKDSREVANHQVDDWRLKQKQGAALAPVAPPSLPFAPRTHTVHYRNTVAPRPCLPLRMLRECLSTDWREMCVRWRPTVCPACVAFPCVLCARGAGGAAASKQVMIKDHTRVVRPPVHVLCTVTWCNMEPRVWRVVDPLL